MGGIVSIYDRIYAPGYYVIDTKYFWDMLAHEYGKLIVKDMVKNQVLVKKELVVKDGH